MDKEKEFNLSNRTKIRILKEGEYLDDPRCDYIDLDDVKEFIKINQKDILKELKILRKLHKEGDLRKDLQPLRVYLEDFLGRLRKRAGDKLK